MKTIALPRSRASILSSVLVLGGLTALYFYRRNGGSVRELASRGFNGIKTARGQLGSYLGDTASATEGSDMTTSSKATEVLTSPEDMDRMPAT